MAFEATNREWCELYTFFRLLTEGKVTFSDGSTMTLSFEKGGHAQEFTFPEKTVEWLEFDELKKADDPSPFPALTQFEVYGREA